VGSTPTGAATRRGEMVNASVASQEAFSDLNLVSQVSRDAVRCACLCNEEA
jgi:hypothetical protein